MRELLFLEKICEGALVVTGCVACGGRHTTEQRELPWTPEGAAIWAAQSPLSSAARIKAPTLILSNTRDLRVPITESYKLFRALRDVGVEAEFVAYHLDGHSPTDPYHERDRERRWLAWFQRQL